ncbi:uncharacterized protein V6R79_022732 [Siganus canaliculatus]
MDTVLHISPPDSDSDLFGDLSGNSFPPPEQQPECSQPTCRSRVRSVVSIPQSRHSSSSNEISPTPSRTRAASPPQPPARIHNTGRRDRQSRPHLSGPKLDRRTASKKPMGEGSPFPPYR